MKMKILKICENNIVYVTHIIIFMERIKKTNHLNFHYCFQFDRVKEMKSEYREEMKINIEGGKTADKGFPSFFFSPYNSRTPDDKQQQQN